MGKKRRYSITKEQAEVILLALEQSELTLENLWKAQNDTYWAWQLARVKQIKADLQNYQWEI